MPSVLKVGKWELSVDLIVSTRALDHPEVLCVMHYVQ